MADDTRRTIAPDLIREAHAAGVRVIGRTADEIPQAKAWKKEHREAFAAWDEWYLKNGSPLDKYRQF